jgi:hypothetical protein
MKLLCLFVFILLNLQSVSQESAEDFVSLNGTTVIVSASKDTIWLAADRKVGGTSQQMVKIGELNKIYYGFVGHAVLINNQDTFFNAFRVMEYAIKKGKTLENAFNIFGDTIISRLKIIGDTIQKTRPDAMRGFLNQSYFGFVMTSFVNGKSVIKTKAFGFVGTISSWRVSLGDTNNIKDPKRTVVLGERNTISKFLNQNKTFLDHPNRSKFICLIEKEAKDNPNVGMPVDLVAIYKGGGKWSFNNLRCPN